MIQIYLDCDGVLANFNKGAEKALGMNPKIFQELYGENAFWARLCNTPDFYKNLELMPDALDLYNSLAHLNPMILTGCPRNGWAQKQKQAWRSFWFPKVKMITCKSENKSDYCKKGDVLIDDWSKYRKKWEKKGGVFIKHLNANYSLLQLTSIYPELF